MKKKAFDCVDLQHRGGQRVREELRGMSPQEVEAYWRRRNQEFLRWFKARRRRSVTKAPALRRGARQTV